jgi:uncharacterized protein (TIGR02391 family)
MNRVEFVSLTQKRLGARGYSAQTVEAYLRWVKRLGNHYPGHDLDQLSDAQVSDYIRFLRKRRLSTATVRQAAHALTTVYKATIARDLDLEAARVSWQKPKAPEVFTPEEVLAVFDNAGNESYALMFKLIYGAGLGLSETLRLRVSDIDVENELLYVQRRGGSSRATVLPSSINEDMADFIAGRDQNEKVWKGRGSTGDKAMAPSTVQKAFRRAVGRTGNPRLLTVKSLRYSYIKHLQAYGVPLSRILDELGLKSEYVLSMMSQVGADDFSLDISPLDIISKNDGGAASDPLLSPNWTLLHPEIVKVAKARFESGHRADSVSAALKEVETRVRDLSTGSAAEGRTGAALMQKALTPKDPVIRLSDTDTQSGFNIQNGYMQIFAGAMSGIRNPKAHGNTEISAVEAINLLHLASLLMLRIDGAQAETSKSAA